MQASCRFSILLPAFRARYLKECLASILAQSFRDFELIVVDDASEEDLLSIVRSFDDPRIRYYRNEVGCGAERVVDNWNICLGYAKGEFVLNMGDDDMLEQDCLLEYDRLVRSFPSLDVYHIRTTLIDENGEVIRLLEERPQTEDVLTMIQCRWSGRMQMIGDYLFRREPLVEQGGFYYLPFAWGSDDVTVFRAAAAQGIANSNFPGFRFRKSRYSISGSTSNVEGKLRSLPLYRAWFRSFFGRRLCGEARYFRTQRIYFLSCDRVHPFRWWLRNRKAFGLSLFDCLAAYGKKRLHAR